MKNTAIPVLVLYIVSAVPVVADDMSWQKAVATAEVFMDKAEECKNYYKYKIDKFFAGCEFLNKNYYGNKDSAMLKANSWVGQQLKSMSDDSPEKIYMNRYLKFALEFREHTAYINLNE